MVEKQSRKSVSRTRGRKESSKPAVAEGADGGVIRKAARAAGRDFPIVGLGASAGGLEALEEFFTQMPSSSGMAFVVVTHQHPGHTSLLPELLGKHTDMPVVAARNGERVLPNHVYLSRPARSLAMVDGALHLMEQLKQDGLHLPIDHFFRSLAEDQGARAIGIILSGTGTDGTLGLKAIKGAAGMTMTMAQEPGSAKYSGMPESAIATGLVDYVLRPAQMPPFLLAYSRGPHLPAIETVPAMDAPLPEPMQKVVQLLRGRTGHNFAAYKPTTIRRRIERRMAVHQLKNLQKYLRFAQDNPHELDLLFRELLIGVTSFFRDRDAFDALAKNALPAMLNSRPNHGALRVWLPGCSTGEEAYSVAIALRECADRHKERLAIQLFATDLDGEAIETARAGLYPDGIALDVPAEKLERYFIREDGAYRIKKIIREMVVFAPQNVIKDPPFTKLDLIVCRNLLIYLKPEMQKRLISVFHYALRPGGLMFLGPSENLGDFSHYFEVVDKKWKIFARTQKSLPLLPHADLPVALEMAATEPSSSDPTVAPGVEAHPAAIFEKLLVKWFVPASVIVNARGDISYIHGRTGDYLEPASGQPRLNLLEMAREGLRFELSSALRQAVAQSGEEIALNQVRVKTAEGTAAVNVAVKRLTEPETMRGLLLVTFRPQVAGRLPGGRRKAVSKRQAGQVEQLSRELEFTRESLQSSIEELQSSNEELQSMNEEMQSTNEELETSREEMQSLHEDLQTVNSQLQAKVAALSETNDDMQNLLNSTSIATIFLDRHLKIKRFTELATEVVNLIPSDVGRPIGDLVSNLNYGDLPGDAAEVLRTLHFKERELQTKKGSWRLVRMQPYRTTENVIEGVVITFVDINRVKEAEVVAQQARRFAESIIATVREPILVLDGQLRVISANQSFCRFFRTSRKAVEQQRIYELEAGKWNIPRLRKLLEDILRRNTAFPDYEIAHDFPRIGRKTLRLNARRLKQLKPEEELILLAMEEMKATK